jgi:thioredoxin 1
MSQAQAVHFLNPTPAPTTIPRATIAIMPDKTIHISSSSQFSSSLASSTYNVVDFHATWCGPCKTIAPVFHALAEKETKPGKIQFLKVDVDACQDIARKHGVSA